MVKETIALLVKGGAATAGPPLGPALGPIGINISQVVKAINEKTSAIAGMDVPVKVIVDKDTKQFEISVGTPPTSALLKKEVFIEKGSGSPKLEKAGDIPFDHIIKVAQIKKGSTLSSDMKSLIKEVVGACQSTGILVDGKEPKEVIKEINEGKYDEKITGKVEFLSEEAMKARNRPYLEAAIERAKKKATEKEAAAAAPAAEKEGEAPKEEAKKAEKKEKKR